MHEGESDAEGGFSDAATTIAVTVLPENVIRCNCLEAIANISVAGQSRKKSICWRGSYCDERVRGIDSIDVNVNRVRVAIAACCRILPGLARIPNELEIV